MNAVRKSSACFAFVGFILSLFYKTIVMSQVPAPAPVVPTASPVPPIVAPAGVMPAPIVVPVAIVPAAVPAPAPVVVIPVPTSVVAAVPTLPAAIPAAIPSATPVPTPTPVPAQPSVEERYKKEFEEINNAMTRINDARKEIKDALSGFDEKMTKARAIAGEVKQASLDLLKQDTEQQARELFAKMQDQVKELKDIQKFGQENFSKANTEKTTEINTLIAKVGGIVTQLQTLVTVASAASAPGALSTPTGAPNITPANQSAQTTTTETRQGKQKKDLVVQKSFMGRAWQLMTDTVTQIVFMLNRGLDWMISIVKPSEKKKSIVSIPDASLSLVVLKTKAKECVTDVNQIISPLETQCFDATQQFQEVSQKINDLELSIAKIQPLKEYLLKQNVSSKKEAPLWKTAIVQLFSKVIDLGIALFNAAVHVVYVAYSYVIEPMIKMFYKE